MTPREIEKAWAERRNQINAARLRRWKANGHPVDGAPGHILQRYREAAEFRARYGTTGSA